MASSLLDNVVAKKPHYRLYIIHKLPKLKLLDFRKIKEKERVASTKLFGAPDKTKAIPISVSSTSSSENNGDVQAIKTAIANAKTLQEVEQLDRALEAGQVPT